MSAIQRSDVSYLFNNSSSSSGTLGIDLGQYASIKNGSYKKIVSAYYNKLDSEEDSTKSTDSSTSSTTNSVQTTAQSLSQIKSDADSLQKSAATLMTKGTESVFKKKDTVTTNDDGTTTTSSEYDTESIMSAVKDFISKYNAFIEDASSSTSSTMTNSAKSMESLTGMYSSSLDKMGISINDDGTLSMDEDVFTSADMSTVKSLFNGSNSFSYQVASKASMAGISATSEANKTSTYTSTGTYSTSYDIGNMLNTLL